MKNFLFALAILASPVLSTGCEQKLEELLLTGGSETPYHKLGLNMFPRNRTTGDLAAQMNDIKSLGIDWIRVTFWFDTFYMPTASSAPNFDRLDEVVLAANAAGINILAVLHPAPDWLAGGGWKTVYVNNFVKPVVSRYKNYVKHWEVWNEPDSMTHGLLSGSADDYFELLRMASAAIRAIDPSAQIVAGATVNIVVDGLDKFNWTQRLIDLGLAQYADILNIHYYSDLDIELSAFGGPLVKSAGMPVWVTETGEKGQGKQKDYFDRNMPYIDKSLGPERIFWYCYVSGAGENEQKHPDDTYGIVTVFEGVRYDSPLYTHLKNR